MYNSGRTAEAFRLLRQSVVSNPSFARANHDFAMVSWYIDLHPDDVPVEIIEGVSAGDTTDYTELATHHFQVRHVEESCELDFVTGDAGTSAFGGR